MATASLSSITTTEHDVEYQRRPHSKVSHFSHILDQAGITQAVLDFEFVREGTSDSPYLVEFLPDDPHNPLNFSKLLKWSITLIQACATLAVTFSSSAYSGGVGEIISDFHASSEVAILGVSIFVLGFAIGPLIWAPLSELYGRKNSSSAPTWP